MINKDVKYKLKVRPKLSYKFVKKGLEYTVGHTIYAEQEVIDHLDDFFPDLIDHECTHIIQELQYCIIEFISIAIFFFLYTFNKTYRLNSECKAYAVSLTYSYNFEADLQYYAEILYSKDYYNCADSINKAKNLLMGYYNVIKQ